MTSQNKVFPLRLPPQFHGQLKTNRKLTDLYQQKASTRDNQQFTQTSVSNWQLKRLDRDVMRERREFLVHPAKISTDTPDWFKTTYHHFHRTNRPERQTNPEQKKFDVFNRKRVDPFAQTDTFGDHPSRFRSTQREVADKIGSRQTHYGSEHWSEHKVSIPIKIGSVDNRDYSVRRPILKIGQSRQDNFINTYGIA